MREFADLQIDGERESQQVAADLLTQLQWLP
jgi:hypothetical protein